MSRGRLIRPLKATFALLDTAAISTAGNYDDEFREVRKTDSNADGIGETQRVEKAEIVINVQVESNRQELQRQVGSGDVPDSGMELVAHRKELEDAGLIAADGRPAIQPRDRLVKISDKFGNVVMTFDRNPLFVTQVKVIDGWLGFRANLIMITVDERRQGLA